MKLIISPAKQMREDADFLAPKALPVLLPETERLLESLRGLPYPELKRLLACSDAIAGQNYRRFQEMDLRRNLTPALLAYQGIQYRYMAPNVLESGDYEWLQDRLRILSGFYGVLRPLDGVVSYRLEMGAKLRTPFCRDLYDFWGDKLARSLGEETDLLLNLASEEYARAVRRSLPKKVRMVDVIFAEDLGDRLVEKGVYVKMARGEMVRFLARTRGETLEDVEKFCGLSYRFAPERSEKDRLGFLRPDRARQKKEEN